MQLSNAQKKLFIFLFPISILLWAGFYFSLFITEKTSEKELISTEEQAIFCSFEDRSKCTTGLALAVSPCQESYYEEACENIALAILNDPTLFLANPYPLQGDITHTKPDAWLTYTQENIESGRIILEPSVGYSFVDDRLKSDNFFRFFTIHGEPLTHKYDDMKGKVNIISQYLEPVQKVSTPAKYAST